jgi:RNA polymerase sigma-70 factor (ECF subfamily)
MAPSELPVTQNDRQSEPAASDASLLSVFRQGNQDAATQLYLRYAKRLRALIREQCSNELSRRLEEDDIVQSVFRTFFTGAKQGLYKVPGGQDLWKLLLVISLNKIRAKGAYHSAAKRDARRTSSLDAVGVGSEPSDQDGGEQAFFYLVIREALEHLPAEYREIVQLRIEGYEVDEIATKSSRAKRTVERILQEARRRLGALLQIEC